jgi:aspartate/methionine/tyrosine aminotransferase
LQTCKGWPPELVNAIAFGHLCGNSRFHGPATVISPSRRSEAEPFFAMDILAEANRMKAAGHDVVSMAVGQPADPAPQAVREAASRAIEAGRIGYTDALGRADLRAAIAEYYRQHHRLEVAPDRIVVTTGSSAGFNLAFLALFDPGDRVAITAPGYPPYRNILRVLGLEVIEIALEEGAGAYLTASQLRAAHAATPLKGVLFASPANPTGAVIPDDELKSIVETAAELGISVISDEIYHRLNFSSHDTTALALSDDVAVINSFSKYYCMTGWRIGWMVLPRQLVRPIERIAQSLYISAPEVSQIAAVAAFGSSTELDTIKARYAINRSVLAEHLPKMGFRFLAPMDGAFYAYCDVSRHTNDSMDFAWKMLREADVAATPGRDFDPAQGYRTMRFSYAGSLGEMQQAVARLERWIGRN